MHDGIWMVRSGSVPGHTHRRLGINRQDAFCVDRFEIGSVHYISGFVADGMTGKDKRRSRTEVGAALLTMYAASEVRLLASANVPLHEIPQALYPRCVGYVGNITRMSVAGPPTALWDFIEKHFLTTLFGFVSDGLRLVVFHSGDGVIVLNDEVQIIEQGNTPLYLAYHQVDRQILGSVANGLPSSFDYKVYDLSSIQRFALCTDGIVQLEPDSKRPYVSLTEVSNFWDYEPEAPAGLQWWLNVQSSEQRRFDDDCTVVAVQRKLERA